MSAAHRLQQTALANALRRRRQAVRWMARLGRRGRARQAAICPGEAHAAVEPGIPEWDFLPEVNSLRRPHSGVGNPPNGNILVGGGEETNRDPLSRGDRKGVSPNQTRRRRVGGDVVLLSLRLGFEPGRPTHSSRSGLESPTEEGDSPVGETVGASAGG